MKLSITPYCPVIKSELTFPSDKNSFYLET